VTRRDFITLVGGAAAWPLAARAEQSERMRRIGELMGVTEDEPEGQARISAFRECSAVPGVDRGAEHSDRGPLGWRDHRRHSGSYCRDGEAYTRRHRRQWTPLVDALHKATRSIPIVFAQSNDPVGLGHVASMARPGGNITDFTFIDLSLTGKWLQFLADISPAVSRCALLFNPDTTPYYLPYLSSIDASPTSYPLELKGAPVRSTVELEGVIQTIAREGNGSLISPAGPFNVVHSRKIAQLAEQLRLPAISIYSQFAADGGLMAYGPDTRDIFRRSAQ
jgi:putative tryptophan/tyrosine transport system substrate-binding protein